MIRSSTVTPHFWYDLHFALVNQTSQRTKQVLAALMSNALVCASKFYPVIQIETAEPQRPSRREEFRRPDEVWQSVLWIAR